MENELPSEAMVLLQRLADSIQRLEQRLSNLENAEQQRVQEQRRNKQYGLCTDQKNRIY